MAASSFTSAATNPKPSTCGPGVSFNGPREGKWTTAGKASSVNAQPANARDVYVYFDNDAKVRAPFDAMALEKRVSELQDGAR